MDLRGENLQLKNLLNSTKTEFLKVADAQIEDVSDQQKVNLETTMDRYFKQQEEIKT